MFAGRIVGRGRGGVGMGYNIRIRSGDRPFSQTWWVKSLGALCKRSKGPAKTQTHLP